MNLKIQNNQLSFFNKITGTNIADLAGLNKFKPKGDAVLAYMGLVKEPFDRYYTDRGALAEEFALRSLTKRGKKCVVYDKKKVNYDNFPENPYFGGLIDIEIPSERTLYEIKSKSLKDYKKISENGDVVQEAQALHYGYLRNYDTVHIMWIFFDEKSEEEIRAGKPLSTLKNLKMFEKPLTVNYEEQHKLHHDALLYLVHCLARQSVPLSDVSDKYLELLKLKRADNQDCQNGNSGKFVQLQLDL